MSNPPYGLSADPPPNRPRALPREFLLVFAAFLALTVAVGLRSQGYLENGLLFWKTNASEFRVNTRGDANAMVGVAEYFLGKRPYDAAVAFTLSTWPPAFPLIAAAVIGLTGEALYLAKLFFLSAVLLALCLACAFRWFPIVSNGPVRWLILASILVLPEFRHWTLQGGTLMAESTTVYAMFFAWSAAFFGLEAKGERVQLRYFFAGALAFAVAAYLRSVNSTVTDALCLATLALTALHAVGSRIWNPDFRGYRDLWRPGRSARTLVIAGTVLFGAASLSTLPWKLRNLREAGAFSMSAMADYQFTLHWNSPDAEPWFMHGSAAACAADPVLCALVRDDEHSHLSEYRKPLSLMTLAGHPGAWIRYKLRHATWLWFGVGRRPEPGERGTWTGHFAEGLIYLLLGFATLRELVLDRRRLAPATRAALLFYFALFTFAHALVFLIAHFEARYSLYLREFMAWSCLAVFSRPRRSLVR